jgi:outer membrane protein assembly factor BamB/precorrin-6B methylase 2
VFHRTASLLLLSASAALLTAPAVAEPLSPGGHWPQWRGPERTNLSTETGLLKEWPEGGPPLLWKTEGLGQSVPSVAVAGGKVYVLGYREEKEFLTALSESDGKPIWSVSVGPAVNEMPAMRWLSQRTPTVDGERVYAFTARGELICLATANGQERWRKNYVAEFGGQPGTWGYCDFPLVDGERLICTPGGQGATLAALDKRSGLTVWKCVVPDAPRATYGAVITAEISGVRQYVHQLENGIVGVAAADGKLLWHFSPFGNRSGNVHTALVRGDEVFASGGWGIGIALLKLTRDGAAFKVSEVYRSKSQLDSWLGSSVRLGGFVHAANGVCIEWKTGRMVAQPVPVTRTSRGTMTCADGRLYHRTGNNVVTLTEVTAEGVYVKRGQIKIPVHSREPTWTFPVVAGGHLYLRDQDILLCYDVRDKKPRRKRPDVIFVPTPQDVVEKMLELAVVKKDDVVADLGCGDGRIVVTAAKKYGCKAIGYDLDKECIQLAQDTVKKEGVEKLVRIENRDILEVDLSGISVVTLYLGPVLNAKLIPQLEKLKPGSRIVSHAFDIPGVKADKVVSVTSVEDDITRKLYLWTTPLKKESGKP